MFRRRIGVLATVLALTVSTAAGTPGHAAQPAGQDDLSSTSTRDSDELGAAPRLAAPAGAITFSEFGLGTQITTQYRDQGVVFNEGSFITADSANPTSPVLSGTPKFQGEIALEIVDPGTGGPAATSGIEFDVGYIDSRNSVEIAYYGLDGARLGAVRANAIGINHIRLPLAGIHRVTIDNTEEEPAGFAIDNVSTGTALGGRQVNRMIAMGDSYSSGEGYIEDIEKRLGRDPIAYDCGTAMRDARYHENSEWLRFELFRGDHVRCDTTTKQPISFADARKRPAKQYENRCHRHGRAWPQQVSRSLGVAANDFLFTACSGAVTENLGLISGTGEAQYRMSPNSVAGGNIQVTDAKNFKAEHGSPDLVTLGVGGNDASFAGLVKACLAPDLHTIFGTVDCRVSEGSDISRVNGPVFDKLVTTFSNLRAEFEDAEVLVYGYPSALQAALGCLPGTFNAAEREYLQNRFLPTLNQAIEDAAATAGVTYMPLFAVTAGHEICTGTDDAPAWVNALRLDDIQESFHPNQLGHDAIAAYFLKHYVDDQGRLLFANPEPNPTIRGPRGPITVAVGNVRADPSGQCGVECLQPACSPSDCALRVRGENFSPNSEVRIVLNSDPVDLGTVTTDAAGELDVTLPVPTSVPDGEHRVDITGASPDGIAQIASTPVMIERVTLADPDAPPSTTTPTTSPPAPPVSTSANAPIPQGSPQPPTSDLASTGADVALLAGIGLLAVLVGLLAIIIERKRRRQNPAD
ncbi:SGNH/GDSL hydrolase family protein [Actinokineospora diospyrosa]|uniref:GDSL-like Lipase/Acylhydrolase family protein n=1 Tax=Actinokineospora diospyrosa TaxID=103728 RepID=A0ABT1IIY7_9PSEU|nr:SGNH/GDSL hydrolase family protein [Actinokineospora diospyrosa]MCP2272618.1 GDSL-like Lipase/Acylhydrolase family protein [Actinokineospora diospyrosa]